jgi:hypothetical protein
VDAANLVVGKYWLDSLEGFAFVGVAPKRLTDFPHHAPLVPTRKVQINVTKRFVFVKVFPRPIRVVVNPFEVAGRPVFLDKRICYRCCERV